MVVSFPSARIRGKESACSVEPQFCSLGLENLLEKEWLSLHYSYLENPGLRAWLQFMGSQGVRGD